MKKRFRKIGIAARLTAVVAVILAVFLVPWVWQVAKLAQDKAREEANASMEANTGWLMRDLEVLKGDAARYPAAGTEEYDLLRGNLWRDGVDTPYYNVDTPYIIRYYDENHKRVLIKSPLMLYYHPSSGMDYGIDLSDFSEQSLREMNEAYTHELSEPIVTVYGRQVKTDTQVIFFPNRIQIVYEEWTAQTPVEETNQFCSDGGEYIGAYIPGKWPFRTDEVMEGYFDALRYLDTELRAIDGENIPDEEWAEIRASKRYVGTLKTMPYDGKVIFVTAALVNRESAYGTCFYLMPPITIALYLIFVFLFYKIVRRMVSDPLVDTAREANRVSILAFDEFKPDLNRGDEIGELNRALSEMAATLHTRWDSERDLEDKRQQFVSAASHDLKTPLTSILNYSDLLGKMDLTPEEANDYARIIYQKGLRLKNLTSDLFDISKVQSGAEQIISERLDACTLARQALAEQDKAVQESGLTVKAAIPERELPIWADGRKLSRVLENLIGNCVKYALKGTRVFLSVAEENGQAIIELKNTANYEMDFAADEITERFVRGDAARSTEGSGLGLAIAKSYTEACGGTFDVSVDGDQFKVRIGFPVYGMTAK